MKVKWKHRKAEQEVAVLLRRAASFDPSLLEIFPRPIEELLSADFTVAFESVQDLTARKVVEILRSRYRVDHEELLTDGDTALAGYTFACGDFAVVFSESGLGEEFQLFTKAHEAGHLVVEYWPMLAAADQMALFGSSSEPSLFARRDPLGHIFIGSVKEDSAPSPLDIRQLRADHDQWLREVIANGFAAELLAPYREVGQVVAKLPQDADAVRELQSRFGLSKAAAQVRLSDLELADDNDEGQFLSP